ncbi:MAG TPA: hypothetical protein VG847_13945 [Chitinophagaceae bacterium]|nr:hypothetical protein [Chitinophagaceae bacterium]
MKQVYGDLIFQESIHSAGLWKVDITPREWLYADPVIDFATGTVLNAVTLKANKFWLRMQLTPASYDYSETPKNVKSGDYYEIALSGLLNTFNPPLQQIIETIRFSDIVAIVFDRNQRRKLFGNTNNGLKLTVTHSHKNTPAGVEQLAISLTGQSEILPPYYNPDDTPDIEGNFLIDADGNYLLIE